MPAPKGHPNYDTQGLAGRPATYTDEIINDLADEFEKWLKYPTSIFFKDFCLEKHINPDLMSVWEKKNERFAGVYKLAKHIQESRLKKGALYKTFDTGFTKFLLVNHHGAESYSDKTESKLTTNDESVDEFVMNRIKSTKDLVNDISTDD